MCLENGDLRYVLSQDLNYINILISHLCKGNVCFLPHSETEV